MLNLSAVLVLIPATYYFQLLYQLHISLYCCSSDMSSKPTPTKGGKNGKGRRPTVDQSAAPSRRDSVTSSSTSGGMKKAGSKNRINQDQNGTTDTSPSTSPTSPTPRLERRLSMPNGMISMGSRGRKSSSDLSGLTCLTIKPSDYYFDRVVKVRVDRIRIGQVCWR
eukprot:sb/3472474/